jgi:hypothetical protein
MRSIFLQFTRPDLDEDELNEVKATLASGWITTSTKTHQFGEKFASAVGARYAIAVNSGTAALHLALDAIGLRSGDEVITSPYTSVRGCLRNIRFGHPKALKPDTSLISKSGLLPSKFDARAFGVYSSITPHTIWINSSSTIHT